MFSIHRLIPTLALMLGLFFGGTHLAHGQAGGPNGPAEGGGHGPSGEGGGRAGLSGPTTTMVVKAITRGVSKCQKLERVYRFDCYRQAYRFAASLLNGHPAYSDARKALEAVEATLDKIVKRHADPRAPTKRKGLQTFRPIKRAAVPRATAQMTRALDQAETVLLRAPERTGTHYARIAEAVQSNKVLLRSRLYPDADQYFQSAFA